MSSPSQQMWNQRLNSYVLCLAQANLIHGRGGRSDRFVSFLGLALEVGSHLAGPGQEAIASRGRTYWWLAGGLPGPLAAVSDGIPSENSWQGPGHRVQREADGAGRVEGEDLVHTSWGPQASTAGVRAKASRHTQLQSVGEADLEGPQGSFGPLWRWQPPLNSGPPTLALSSVQHAKNSC